MKKYGWLIVATVLLGFAASLLIAGDAAKETSGWREAWGKKDAARIAADDAKRKAEVKWARAVATDFLEAAISGQKESAWALLTPELAQEMKGHAYLVSTLDCYSNPTITSEEAAPNGNEVIVAGMLKSKLDGHPDEEFKMRVVRESGTRPWKIRFVLMKEHGQRKSREEWEKELSEGIKFGCW